MQRKNILLAFIWGLMLMALQFPFLFSDPDINISTSRGANIDEGLYTCQVRNLVNHGDLTFENGDCVVKNPLYSALLIPPFKVFGTTLVVGRLTILLLSLSICLWIFAFNKYYAQLGMIAFVLVYLQFYIFHFFHFCLAEILSTAFIFLAVVITLRSSKSNGRFKPSFLSATFISLSYYLKIQFLYALALLPGLLILFWLFNWIDRKKGVRQLLMTGGILGAYLLLYVLFWYLPNQELYDYVIQDQTGGRFIDLAGLYDHLVFTIDRIFGAVYLKFFTCCYFVFFMIGVGLAFAKKNRRFSMLFVALNCWIILELHKIPMTYLPTRYLIPLFFTMGMIMSLVTLELFQTQKKSNWILACRGVSLILLLAMGIQNTMHYSAALRSRTYSILEINQYLANFDFKDRPIVGAWAPALTWNSKAISIPIWKGYFNDEKVIETFDPAMIIAEKYEQDSNQAFAAKGIKLNNYADSIKYHSIHNWNLKLLWVKEKIKTD